MEFSGKFLEVKNNKKGEIFLWLQETVLETGSREKERIMRFEKKNEGYIYNVKIKFLGKRRVNTQIER